jgi:NAD(P)-dependent dehydrogenase (short-subunit alcohol dehydrogenase family)
MGRATSAIVCKESPVWPRKYIGAAFTLFASASGPLRDAARAHRRAWRGRRPLGRGSSPEERASLIWFLLSSEAAYMTGQAINFTGGLVTW